MVDLSSVCVSRKGFVADRIEPPPRAVGSCGRVRYTPVVPGRRPFFREFGAIAATVAIGSLVGCESTPAPVAYEEGPEPTVLSIAAASYPEAFRAAHATLSDAGFRPELEDRDGGLIESRPLPGGSLLEPWAWADGDPWNGLADTVAWQRRVARFEFVPLEFRTADAGEVDRPDLPGMTAPRDLARHDGPIEVRVWVFVERAFKPDLRRSDWTFQLTTTASNPKRTGSSETGGDPSRWTPIGRDPALEVRLRDRLGERLASAPPSGPAPAPETIRRDG